jgi:aminoglycoside 2''-phosphotransferase
VTAATIFTLPPHGSHTEDFAEMYRRRILAAYPDLDQSKHWRPRSGEELETEHFLQRIRDAFPELQWTQYRRMPQGSDVVAIVLDESIVFRFIEGNEAEDIVALLREIEILKRMRDLTSVPIPEYCFLPDAPDFAGYWLVPGSPLTTERFLELSDSQRSAAAQELGEFVSDIHSLPVAEAKSLGVDEEDQEERLPYYFSLAARTLDSHRDRLDPEVRSVFTRWLSEIDTTAYAKDATFCHADIWHKHILHDPALGRITGIIDWTNLCIDDRARDFAGCWTYGERFTDMVLAHYDGASENLKRRSLACYKAMVVLCASEDESKRGFGWQLLADNLDL